MLMCSLLDVLKSLLCVFGLELGKYTFVFYPHGFTPNHNPVPKTGAQLFQHLEIMEGSNEFRNFLSKLCHVLLPTADLFSQFCLTQTQIRMALPFLLSHLPGLAVKGTGTLKSLWVLVFKGREWLASHLSSANGCVTLAH